MTTRRSTPVRKPKKEKDRIAEFYKLSSMVMSKVGVIGFLVITLVAYIFFFVPQNLKNDLTNTWLLFKCQDCQIRYVFILVLLAIIILSQNHYYRKALKLKDSRIKEIAKEKSELQEKLLNKKLKSTEEVA